jgi:hypothetical protein
MPDLLSHAFIAYTLCTLLSIRYPWITPQYVTVGMAGAFVPDMSKSYLALDSTTIGSTVGMPFDWFALHTLGGSAVAVLVGITLTPSEHRRRVGALLGVGAASHLVADALLLKASGHSYPLLWPLTRYHPPTPGLYLSADMWPSVVTGGIALGAWLLVRRPESDSTSD